MQTASLSQSVRLICYGCKRVAQSLSTKKHFRFCYTLLSIIMMNLFNRSITLSVLVLFMLCSSFKPHGKTRLPLQKQPDPDFHLYLLIGQSNMSGRGVITEEFEKMSDPEVLMLDKNNEWVVARHPLHFDKPARAGVGPGLSFGMEMHKHYPGVKIGLIPCAVGGTPIESWQPGVMDRVTKQYAYDQALDRLKIAMQQGVIKGIIWLQGEANSTPEKSKNYMFQLEELIKRLRGVCKNEKLPFVAGELGPYRENYSIINNLIKSLPDEVPYTAIASSKGLKDKGDRTHFDSPSANELGKRFAAEMLHLQNK